MATKANFTADEWKVILSSPALAGMAVTLAEPSGIWGMMKEGMASGSALLETKAILVPANLPRRWSLPWKRQKDEVLPAMG
jgi:hypothetical protein